MIESIQELKQTLNRAENVGPEKSGSINDLLPDLFRSAGYSDEHIRYDLTYENEDATSYCDHIPDDQTTFRVDAVASHSHSSTPRTQIITTEFDEEYVEIYPGNRGEFSRIDTNYAKTFHVATGAYTTLFLTNCVLVLVYDEREGIDEESIIKSYSPGGVTQEDAEELYLHLAAPDLLSRKTDLDEREEDDSLAPDRLIRRKIKTDNFSIDLKKFSITLQKVEHAGSAAQKGQTLEDLAELLIDSTNGLAVRKRNFRTTSSEIDVVAEIDQETESTIFHQFGQFLIVECKNWSASVSADVIRDFGGKLSGTDTQLGILFARNGISGAQSGRDAQKEISNQYRDGKYVVVIDGNDLSRVVSGTSWYEILDEKLFNLRFD